MEVAVGALVETCDDPREADWFAARHPTSRRTVLAPIIARAHTLLAPAEKHVAVLREVSGAEGRYDAETVLVFGHERLCGRLHRLESLKFREPNIFSSMYSAWERFVRGS